MSNSHLTLNMSKMETLNVCLVFLPSVPISEHGTFISSHCQDVAHSVSDFHNCYHHQLRPHSQLDQFLRVIPRYPSGVSS